MHHPTLCTVAVALLSALPGTQAIYTKKSPVLQVEAKNYDRLIAKSNYTSVCQDMLCVSLVRVHANVLRDC